MPDPETTAELLDDQIVSLAPARRESSRPALQWLALAALLTIGLAAGISYVSRPGASVALVASPSPGWTVGAAIASAEASPTPDPDLCGGGSFEIEPSSGDVIGETLRALRLTQPGAVALSIDEDRSSGWIIVARSLGDEGGNFDAGYAARFVHDERQVSQAVTPVSWTAAGDAILVDAQYLSPSDFLGTCNDLFLVQADGSRVTRLTLNRRGDSAESSSMSPDGRQVAFVVGGQLRLTEVDRGTLGVPLSTCDRPAGPIRWSPDGWLLVICGGSISVADLQAGGWHSYGTAAGGESEGSLPRDSIPLAAGWTADGQSIIAVTAPAGLSQLGPLKIVAIKRSDGTPTASVATEAATEWVLGITTMSPDGRWALVQGDGNVAAATWFPTYAVNTSTGAATKLPWTVLHDLADPNPVSWLAEPDRFLYEEDQALYEVDLATMTRAEVGALPLSAFAWYEQGTFTPATP